MAVAERAARERPYTRQSSLAFLHIKLWWYLALRWIHNDSFGASAVYAREISHKIHNNRSDSPNGRVNSFHWLRQEDTCSLLRLRSRVRHVLSLSVSWLLITWNERVRIYSTYTRSVIVRICLQCAVLVSLRDLHQTTWPCTLRLSLECLRVILRALHQRCVYRPRCCLFKY